MPSKPSKPMPWIPKQGDKVIPKGSQTVYTVWSISADGTEANLEMTGAPLLNRYRVPVRDLTRVKD